MTKFAVKNKSTVVLRRYASAIAGLKSAAPFIGRQIAESAAIGLRRMTLSEEAKDQIIDMMNREPDQKLRAREMPTRCGRSNSTAYGTTMTTTGNNPSQATVLRNQER